MRIKNDAHVVSQIYGIIKTKFRSWNRGAKHRGQKRAFQNI
ncbi:hypothetical protein FM107_20040 [Sphingobacterium sp. JB170]|nr:hypothetical protein FM107_20040 [Sphingobacterium sp. JB170]